MQGSWVWKVKIGYDETSLGARYPHPHVACLALCRLRGRVAVSGLSKGFGLATQEPWIQFATIRDNILFGKTFDAQLYKEVLEACALSEDLSVSACPIHLLIACKSTTFSCNNRPSWLPGPAIKDSLSGQGYSLKTSVFPEDSASRFLAFSVCHRGVMKSGWGTLRSLGWGGILEGLAFGMLGSSLIWVFV